MCRYYKGLKEKKIMFKVEPISYIWKYLCGNKSELEYCRQRVPQFVVCLF